MFTSLRHGVCIHHAGLLPKYHFVLEKLTARSLLKVVGGTDTLGVGVNVPIRTDMKDKLKTLVKPRAMNPFTKWLVRLALSAKKRCHASLQTPKLPCNRACSRFQFIQLPT